MSVSFYTELEVLGEGHEFYAINSMGKRIVHKQANPSACMPMAFGKYCQNLTSMGCMVGQNTHTLA